MNQGIQNLQVSVIETHGGPRLTIVIQVGSTLAVTSGDRLATRRLPSSNFNSTNLERLEPRPERLVHASQSAVPRGVIEEQNTGFWN